MSTRRNKHDISTGHEEAGWVELGKQQEQRGDERTFVIPAVKHIVDGESRSRRMGGVGGM